MKRKLLSTITLSLLILSCSEKGAYYVEDVNNPAFKKNLAFQSFEDLSSAKFAALQKKYRLDTIFKGEEDEFTRVLLIRQWINDVIKIDDYKDHYSGEGYAKGILDAALKGEGFHCGHYMIVQNSILNAYGYVTRCLGAGPGKAGLTDGHHGINEVWLNSYNKWVLSDAKYNHHFEKNGIPLSALEVRDEYLKNKAADVVMVKGNNRVQTDVDFDNEFKRDKESFAQTYSWIEWHVYNDRSTVWPDYKFKLIIYEDEYTKNNTWIWDKKPHWAYNSENLKFMNTEHLEVINDRDVIEWTPNTITSEVQIKGDIAQIELTSNTPNLSEYQMKTSPKGDWQSVAAHPEIELKEDRHELVFRTVNLVHVAGPEHKILIKRK